MNLKRTLLWVLTFCSVQLSAQKTETIFLSGRDADQTVKWDFLCSKGMNSGRWKKIAVPSCWEQQGFGAYTYGRYYKKGGTASDETGLYRYSFKVPKDWNGKTVKLCFEGVMTDATVKVNGMLAGEPHQGGFTAFSYDVSSLLLYGKKNQLEVFVEKQSKDKSVNAAERRADWWLFGGIYRPVSLKAMPKTNLTHVGIDARQDGTLRLRLSTSQLTEGYSLKLSIPGFPVRTVALKNLPEQTVETRWEGVKEWNTEQPSLYTLNLQLIAPDGKTEHEITKRIGFRTIEFRKKDGFYLNGTKLLVKGVNRHCFYPETGRTTSKRKDIEDIKLIRAMNANAIRSHYPPSDELLSICDSLGILYFDELPGWQNHYNTTVGKRILTEMLLEDANHPCVFAWGNGNEGGFNLDLDPMFYQLDLQQRHVVHPWALFDGVDAHHYPAYLTGVARLQNGSEVFMPTEFLHSQYDKGAGASLDEYWIHWRKNPLFAGGFIWAWVDEDVMRTDKQGMLDSDGTNAPDGIVGPHREKEASWFTVRDVWSPIQIAPVTVRRGSAVKFSVNNDFLFSDLASVRMEYQVLSVEMPKENKIPKRAVLSTGTITLPHALPQEVVNVVLPKDKLTEGDVLRLTALNPKGDTLNSWTFPMEYTDEYVAKYQEGVSSTSEAKVESSTLSANGIKAVFNASTGMLQAVYNGEQEIPFNNGPIPVGMKMELQNITSRTDKGDALLVMHYTGAADSIVWRMTKDGLLGMDAVILNKRDGGKFKGKFFDEEVRNLGFSFSYPERTVKGMRWLGKGAYRVWKNRQRGMLLDLWEKDYNNTVTGQPDTEGKLVYPEFKGYHANLYWAQMLSKDAPFTVVSETDGLYYRVFTPEEPRERNNGEPTMQPFPEGDISFLLEIPGIRSYKTIEQLGPDAQPSHIRINIGDEGLRIKLWFDFRTENGNSI